MNDSNYQTNQSSGKQNQAKIPTKKRKFILPILFIAVGCAIFIFVVWLAVKSPVLALIFNQSSADPELGNNKGDFAQVFIPKPAYTPASLEPVAILPSPTATQFIEQQVFIPATATLEALPTATVEVLPTATVEVAMVETATPSEGVAYAEIVPDTPTPEYVAPTAVAYQQPSSPGNGVHWFDVDLSDQRMYAYEGDTLVNTFVVSTGTWQTPTVTGRFKVWIKLKSAPMSGPGYYLPDVPYIMYFYGDYGIHGTYWHNNFGVPMSHGCVNLSIPDAEWAYNFAVVGTVVNVHE
ncbi:MAG: ErfK/YbiS/YcfS/YnhG family protein [Chloroflexi bacterium OLB14]|nr:MAG: ErfK/YbiS/YcfS/YnhG family protein [Chloroflexi bacterium OLB14]